MQMKLPDFRGSHCTGINVCGWTADKGLRKLASRGPIITSYGNRKSLAFVHAFAKRRKPETHIHVDVIRGSYEGSVSQSSRDDLNAFFDQFDGMTVKAVVSAYFLAEMQEVRIDGITAGLDRREVGDGDDTVLVRVTGLEVVRPAEPRWRVAFHIDEDNWLSAEIRALRELVITETYLVEAMTYIENSFKMLFLKPDADEEVSARMPVQHSLSAGTKAVTD